MHAALFMQAGMATKELLLGLREDTSPSRMLLLLLGVRVPPQHCSFFISCISDTYICYGLGNNFIFCNSTNIIFTHKKKRKKHNRL